MSIRRLVGSFAGRVSRGRAGAQWRSVARCNAPEQKRRWLRHELLEDRRMLAADGLTGPHDHEAEPSDVATVGEEHLHETLPETTLTQEQLVEIAAEGARRWASAGISDEQLAALQQITYQVEDLGGVNLGLAESFQITVDDNAAGSLWFIDQTPAVDDEFTAVSATLLSANSETWAQGRMDLLTVVMHEQGHVLGLADQISSTGDLMLGNLSYGQRVLPAAGQADGAEPGTIESSYLVSGVNGGGQAINEMQPFLTTNYAIALAGILPTSNGCCTEFGTGPAQPYLGEIMMFAGSFAPQGWALAQGQLLPIATNQELFNLLGTTFGGDGSVDFALPDLRGRAPIGVGSAPGRTPVAWGQQFGAEQAMFQLPTQNPIHQHGYGSNTSSHSGGDQIEQPNEMPTLGLHNIIDANGEIRWIAFDFAPTGSEFPQGQVLPIVGHATLFANISNVYGGDGSSDFALPDLRGRVVIGEGPGPLLTDRVLGSTTGESLVPLTEDNLPSHNHAILGVTTTENAGGSQPYTNMQPSIALNFQISTVGLFPSQSLVLDGSGLAAIDSEGQSLTRHEAEAALDSLVAAGIARWQATGISAEQLQALESASYTFGDLAAGRLAGFEQPNVITLDADAAGLLWYVDDTPYSDEEFTNVDPARGLVGSTNEALAGIDLLTVLLHEQGHLLGFEHEFTTAALMSESLGAGVRRLPSGNEKQAAEGSHESSFVLIQFDPMLAAMHMFASPVNDPAADASFQDGRFLPTDGQLLEIASNAALHSLLGTIYGGNQFAFRLPDLRGRAAIGEGTGAGLSQRDLGSRGGVESTLLTILQMAPHVHTYTVDFGDAADTAAGSQAGDYETVFAPEISFNGPTHIPVAGLMIGAQLDTELQALQSAAADGDDTDGVPDDEDGLIDAANDLALIQGEIPSVGVEVMVPTGLTATLYGWIDYDGDGIFSNTLERANSSPLIGTGATQQVQLVFPQVPAGFASSTVARFRLSTDPAAAESTGPALDGEVEDHPVTIAAALPTLAIAVVSADKAEGDTGGTTAFTFNVTRSGDTSGTSSVSYQVSGSGSNPADAGDFDGAALPGGTINFLASDAEEPITINIARDILAELDEGFLVTLSNPVGATITTATANGTIRNDDTNISIANVMEFEGDAGPTTFTFDVTSSHAVQGAFTINFGTADGSAIAGATEDYLANSGTLDFLGTAAEVQQVMVTVNGDIDIEPDQDFFVNLSLPSSPGINLPASPATGTIRNDDGAGDPPTLTSVVVATSRIDNIEVKFSEAVNFSGAVADAFMLTNTTTNTAVSIGSAVATLEPGTGVTIVTLSSFDGVSDPLPDGDYTLEVLAALVSSAANGQALDGNGDTVAGDDAVRTFFSLFGDLDGDRDTDYDDFTNFFLPAYLSQVGQPEYDARADFDNDGDVDVFDYIAFRQRFIANPLDP